MIGTLKDRLGAGETLFGTFSLMDSPVAVEMIGYAGFDFVIIDAEHSATSPYGIEALVRAADAAEVVPMVRVRRPDPGQISGVLDAGAQAVVVPHVSSRQTMEGVVRSATLPPAGSRGAAPVVRAARYGLGGWQSFACSASETFVAPLIEDPEGVESVEEILAVEGVGLVMFGAFDLAVALGLPEPAKGGAEIEAARDRVYAAAGRSVVVADYAWDAATARELVARGARCVAVGNDVSMLGAALREAQARFATPAERRVRPRVTGPRSP